MLKRCPRVSRSLLMGLLWKPQFLLLDFLDRVARAQQVRPGYHDSLPRRQTVPNDDLISNQRAWSDRDGSRREGAAFELRRVHDVPVADRIVNERVHRDLRSSAG